MTRVKWPVRIQRVQTLRITGVLPSNTRIFCVLGAQERRVLMWEWLTVLPDIRPLPQISQNFAIVNLLKNKNRYNRKQTYPNRITENILVVKMMKRRFAAFCQKRDMTVINRRITRLHATVRPAKQAKENVGKWDRAIILCKNCFETGLQFSAEMSLLYCFTTLYFLMTIDMVKRKKACCLQWKAYLI